MSFMLGYPRRRWAQTAVAIWLVSRAAFLRMAARELAGASGSCMPSTATAAWSVRIGSACLGMRANAWVSSRGILRAAISSELNWPICDVLGRSPCHRR